jgi:hypothetical protein
MDVNDYGIPRINLGGITRFEGGVTRFEGG